METIENSCKGKRKDFDSQAFASFIIICISGYLYLLFVLYDKPVRKKNEHMEDAFGIFLESLMGIYIYLGRLFCYVDTIILIFWLSYVRQLYQRPFNFVINHLYFPLLVVHLLCTVSFLFLDILIRYKKKNKVHKEAFENFFKKADLNNDGLISESEGERFFRGFDLPDDVLVEIWNCADQNENGYLNRQEFYNALRLVSVAQSGRALTTDIVISSLYGRAAAKIPPPVMESSLRTSESYQTDPTIEELDRFTFGSISYPGSDRIETTSGENHIEMMFNRREEMHKKEIQEILMRANHEADLLKRKNKQLTLDNHRLRNTQDDNLKQLKHLQQMWDEAIKEAEELRNQNRRFLFSDMSLCSRFSSRELEQATENYSDSLKIGEGGFGCVYKGSLCKTTVAIKKLNTGSMQGLPQFQREVAILTKVRHPHLVNLIGSCSEVSALVYEFLPNGSLEDRLACTNNTPSLTWQVRTRIVSEICLALVFLHSSKPNLIIHSDLKPDNILLDANFISKLSDFGISRIVEQPDTDITACYRTANPTGTFAYLDPQFLSTGELTPKSDVYSFGIIVLRLLTGKPPLNIASEVREAMQSHRFETIIDKSSGKWPIEQAEKLALLGLSCVEMSRTDRPNMIEVWATIEPIVKAVKDLESPEFPSNGSIFNEEHVPSHFLCPISQEIMKNPCIAADGFTYETEDIKRWLNAGHNTSPMTNLVLGNYNLIPNHALRSFIQEWLGHRS